MADFFQNGSITTLHNLTRRSIVDLERELSAFAQKRSIGLVLPSLYSELEGPALENIVQELMKVPYLTKLLSDLIAPMRNNLLMQKNIFLVSHKNIHFYGMTAHAL